MKNFYTIHTSLLISVSLLIVIIYYCFIKRQSKQKHLLQFHHINKSKEIDINNITLKQVINLKK